MSAPQDRAATASRVTLIGAGPAGLACASRLRAAGLRDLCILDAGRDLHDRLRTDPDHLAAGVGGAGLFSDGKFSFAPAGTQVWHLPDRPTLQRAYAWVCDLLRRAGLDPPGWTEPNPAPPASGFKPYPSQYLDLPARRALIQQLARAARPNLTLRAHLTRLRRAPDGSLALDIAHADGQRSTHTTQALIYAGGRLGPLLAPLDVPTRFRRIEAGVRIEGPSDHPLFDQLVRLGRSIDPKWIAHSDTQPGVSWRTFCCCRDGEVVAARLGRAQALSGRADGPRSGRSNIGFNARFTHPDHAPDIHRLSQSPPFTLPLQAALHTPQTLAAHLGKTLTETLIEGLKQLNKAAPALAFGGGEGLVLRGPTVEGVGCYPVLDAHLRVPGWPVWVAGDATGCFRGLVPAMLSGAYVGLRLGADLRQSAAHLAL